MGEIVGKNRTYFSIITVQKKILFKEREGNETLKGCEK